MRRVVVFILLAALSIPLGGYQFGVKDQYVTIPIYLHYLDPTLYPNDYYYPQPNESKSLYAPLLAATRPLFPDLPTQFFILYFLFHTLWLYALYKLALVVLKDQKQALFSLLFFITPKWVGGTGAMTYELSLVYRTISMPFALLSLVWILEKRYLYAAVSGIFAGVIHPLTGLYVGFPIYVILWNRLRKLFHLPSFISYLLLPLPFLLLILLSFVFNLPVRMDPEWLAIVQHRLPFTFLSRWNIFGFGAFFFFIILVAITFARNRQLLEKNRTVLVPLAITALMACIVPLFGELFSIVPLVQVQFARALTLPAITTLIVFSSIVMQSLKKLPSIKALAFVILGILSIIYPIRDPDPHLALGPNPKDPWVDVQLWVKANTAKDTIFLTNPYQSGFRVFSERSPIVEYKDGTASIFSRSHALSWKQRIEDLKGQDSMDILRLKALREKYVFDYLVRSKNTPLLSLPLMYENSEFRIYQASSL